MLEGTEGDDELTGFDDADGVPGGGAGSDELAGPLGDEVYRRGPGLGADAISETDGVDELGFGALIAAQPSTLRADGDHLVIGLDGFDDTLPLRDVLGCGDGVELEVAALRAAVLAQATGEGDPVLAGFETDDAMQGGLGDDLLDGRAGPDVHAYARGDGQDVTDDFGCSPDDADRLEIPATRRTRSRRASRVVRGPICG